MHILFLYISIYQAAAARASPNSCGSPGTFNGLEKLDLHYKKEESYLAYIYSDGEK
jgi:hypothetical protein